MKGERSVGGAEASNEVVLEGADGTFGCISSVAVRWHQLEIDFLIVHEVFKDTGAFVVESFEVLVQAGFDEDGVCCGVCLEDTFLGPGFHALVPRG